ncbi:MAG: MATE family efflux transporter [Pikeienuella sp.]
MATPSAPGRFTTGSTMRHVAVMTFTGMAGLSFMFLVDFVTLFYVSLLGNDALTAGVGFAWAVQFFTISAGIGLAIAAAALVSRAIGAREREKARAYTTSATVITFAILSIIAAAVLVFRDPILSLVGAEGQAADVAERFLLISVPSLPFVGLAMITSSVLRAVGDAKRAMFVTMSGGAAAMALDPLFIFGFDMGVDGAATAMVLSRIITGLAGLYFVLRLHKLFARPTRKDAAAFMRPYFGIAGPAIATQMSTPVGNLILTWWMSDYGDSAVAGWAVASRLTVVAFGGIFALSAAIGGIIGQNYGARLADRVGDAYRDSLIFAITYVCIVWLMLILFADVIVTSFGLSGDGAAVVKAFCYIGAGGFALNGALFVANAAFNNLGKPLWSTGFNWSRDAVAIPVMMFLIPASFGAPAIVYAQAAAAVLVGGAATVLGWRLSHGVTFDAPSAEWPPVPGGPTSARSANALLQSRDRVD